MKIIISHDVDHLYPSDHIFRDLIFPKLWIRSATELFQGKITLRVWYFRLISIFDNRLNRIPEIVEFDLKHKIPSIFFFGMDNILGMSYKKSTAIPWINFVLQKGLNAGVHGVEYDNKEKMIKEFNDFQAIVNQKFIGIRTHYVRSDGNTFKKMAEIGYRFDTSQFNKNEIELNSPYKIDNMWEFPLIIMDSYVLKNKLEEAISLTIKAINEGIKKNLTYFPFLFHDYFFNEKAFPKEKSYYEWFIDFCKSRHLEFISYLDAIEELERDS